MHANEQKRTTTKWRSMADRIMRGPAADRVGWPDDASSKLPLQPTRPPNSLTHDDSTDVRYIHSGARGLTSVSVALADKTSMRGRQQGLDAHRVERPNRSGLGLLTRFRCPDARSCLAQRTTSPDFSHQRPRDVDMMLAADAHEQVARSAPDVRGIHSRGSMHALPQRL